MFVQNRLKRLQGRGGRRGEFIYRRHELAFSIFQLESAAIWSHSEPDFGEHNRALTYNRGEQERQIHRGEGSERELKRAEESQERIPGTLAFLPVKGGNSIQEVQSSSWSSIASGRKERDKNRRNSNSVLMQHETYSCFHLFCSCLLPYLTTLRVWGVKTK